jgi:hypothetical protein
MVVRGWRLLFSLVVLVVSTAVPSTAWAWHFLGLVYCDQNANGVIDAPDTRILGVGVRATALTTNPGVTYDRVTDLNGYYFIAVAEIDEDYRVELVSGLPPGSSVVVPSSGAYGNPPVPPFSLNNVFRFANDVNFLLSGCSSIVLPTPTATVTDVPTATPTATEIATPTDVATPTDAPTPTASATATDLPTATPTDVATPTDAPTPTASATATDLPTATPTPTDVATPTDAPTPTATETATTTATPTEEATVTPTATPTEGPTPTATLTVLPTPTATATPGSTSTPTLGTPTPGSTPGLFAPAFQCYEIDRATQPAIKDLPVEDVFGASLIDVGGRGRVKRLCNPASVNGQNAGAPSEPNHLVGYVVNKRTPKLATLVPQTVANVFGTTDLKVLRPILFAMPSAKSLVAPPAPLAPPAIDHYQCYAVGNAGTLRVANVQVVDQFGTLTLDVKRPSRLCVAADKLAEGVLDPAAALMCYQVRASAGATPFRGIDGPVYVDNQLGPDVLKVTRPTELCVPSTVVPSALRRPARRPR